MKLKTSLIAAATLAVGVISSQAQVYSQNIVGYYNVSIPKNGFALVGNQLDVDGTNGVNQVLGSGLVSDPNGNNNTVLYVWNSSVQQYLILQYWNAADAASSLGGTSAGFYDSGGTLQNPSLKPGSAAFLQNVNNSVSNLTATIVGNVQQLTNITTIIPGFNLVSFNVPVATDIVSSNNYTGVSDPNGNNNDVLFLGILAFSNMEFFITGMQPMRPLRLVARLLVFMILVGRTMQLRPMLVRDSLFSA